MNSVVVTALTADSNLHTQLEYNFGMKNMLIFGYSIEKNGNF